MNLFITGLPGSGKSSIAKILRDDFGYNVIEIEKILEVETSKDFYTLVKLYGINQISKMERRIIDRFEKSCDKILVGCGMMHNMELNGFLKIYLKVPKDRFIQRMRKYIKYQQLEEHYLQFHHYYSKNSELVISVEHKTKYEIALIIADFFKKNILHHQNT
ncbi:MAG: shikimate kinase [Fervidobacterium sp.]|uniref:shikimate kinase n=1 Tax=Fervidobacterium sp. TaxID=1871331 RepID=UPI0040490F2D